MGLARTLRHAVQGLTNLIAPRSVRKIVRVQSTRHNLADLLRKSSLGYLRKRYIVRTVARALPHRRKPPNGGFLHIPFPISSVR